MLTLLQKIQASADAKLPDPNDRTAPLDLAPFRNFLKVETHRLKLLHQAGAGGREICRGHAGVIDVLLSKLWNRAKNSLSAQAQREFPPLALAALGGYGRGELNPKSDLDVMVLHDGQVVASIKPLPHLSKMIEFILMPLFDLNFKVGHSVRTIAECVQLANQDMQTKTSLIEARLIVGDEHLFQRFQKTLLAKCVAGHQDEYIQARLADQAARRSKHGNSPTMQEPNVKNGCGGLRDFHNLGWMAFIKHRTRSLSELKDREFVTAGEAKRLEAAYDFLLRVRNQLHYQTDRAVDVLSKSLQPAVAGKLGFSERSPRERLESFMRQYYNHSRHIYLITRTVEERLALVPKSGPLPALRTLIGRSFKKSQPATIDGFLFQNGYIMPASLRIFRDQPRRLMRAFLHMQQRGLKLHPDTAHLIRNQLHLVDRAFLRDEHVHKTFLELLNQRGSVARVLRPMHEAGLLGKFIPEFGKMTCLVQHEFFHQYTADEHTLMCLQQLDRIWESKDPAHARYAEVFQKIERPFILYLALLLHDAGKASPGGDHSKTGAKLSAAVSRRLGLDSSVAASLHFLIGHHLSMSSISQRRDLEDPAVIRNFAMAVQSIPHLHMLALHTVADSLATSDKLWNGFKDTLLWQLFHKTMDVLSGATEFVRAEAKQKEWLRQETGLLTAGQISPLELEVHFNSLPKRYFQMHAPADIAAHLGLTHRFMTHQVGDGVESALKPVVAWLGEPDRGYTTAHICTWDRAGLFSTITGAFSASGINILSAQVFTRADDIVLDSFCVTDGRDGGPVGRESRERFEGLLLNMLTGEAVDLSALIARHTIRHSLYQAIDGESSPLRIEFDNHSSAERTVIEIETEDRIGLLYTISKALTDLGLDISLAKILTEKGGAIDAFYVADASGDKIEAPARQREIEQHLRKILAKPGGPG